MATTKTTHKKTAPKKEVKKKVSLLETMREIRKTFSFPLKEALRVKNL